MPDVGDRVSVQAKAGPRLGRVQSVSGALVTVEWDTGGQTTLMPAPGVMTVTGGGRRPAAKKAAPAKKKAAPAKKKAAAPAKKKAVAAKKKATPAKKKTPVKKKAAPAKKKSAAKKKR